MKTCSVFKLAPLLVSLCVMGTGCADSRIGDTVVASSTGTSFLSLSSHPRLTTGTALHVRLEQTLSSETTAPSETWHGVTVAPVVVDADEVIPAGTRVEGVVRDAAASTAEGGAKLELEMRRTIDRHYETVLSAKSPMVTAGSGRARSLHAMSVASGPVMNGGPVTLRSGTVVTFTVSREVAMR